MKKILVALVFSLTLSSIAWAGKNPGIICVQSDKYDVLIEPEKKQIRFAEWGKVVHTSKITRIFSNLYEGLPNILQISYYIDDDNILTVSHPLDESKGTGHLSYQDNETTTYASCTVVEDIQR